MLDFEFYTPTKVFFGKDKQKDIGKIIKDYGFKKIMLQYGKGSIKKTGLYDEIISSLSEYDIDVVELFEVFVNVLPLISVATIVKPFSITCGGTTNTNDVASYSVEPIFTPSPQSIVNTLSAVPVTDS